MQSRQSMPHLGQIIHQLSFYPKKRLEYFLSLPVHERAEVLLHLTRFMQHELITHLPENDLLVTLEQLDPDEITDMVQLLPKRKQQKVITKLKTHLKQSVELLNQFDSKTAAGLMNIDYIQVTEKATVAQVAKQFKAHEKRTGRLPAIIVLRQGRVIGYIPGHELGFALPQEVVKPYVRHISTIAHNVSHAETITHFRHHPHNKVVVLGEQNNVLGIIYADDVLSILEDQESASLYDFAGVHDEELVTDSVRMKVAHRYKWLIINLGTAFLASFTVSLFDATISSYVLLAVYMPIVAGMGGNAATQTLAVLVRGIALKQIELKTAWKTLVREVGSSLVNGIINGVIVAAVVIVLNRDYKIALILSLAMIANLIVAGIFGTIVPLIMQRLGKDPAASATVFITTATDVLGFLVFLGLATIIL